MGSTVKEVAIKVKWLKATRQHDTGGVVVGLKHTVVRVHIYMNMSSSLLVLRQKPPVPQKLDCFQQLEVEKWLWVPYDIYRRQQTWAIAFLHFPLKDWFFSPHICHLIRHLLVDLLGFWFLRKIGGVHWQNPNWYYRSRINIPECIDKMASKGHHFAAKMSNLNWSQSQVSWFISAVYA